MSKAKEQNEKVTKSIIETVCPRLKEESLVAYIGFADYIYYNCNCIELHKIYTNSFQDRNPPTKSLVTIQSWSKKFNWSARREKWITHQNKIREEKMMLHWDTHREKLLETSSNLIEKAEQMLKHPIIRSTAKDDGRTIVVEPSKWSFRDAATFMDVSTKLVKEAVGDEVWAKELLRRKGYHVFEPGMGDVAMALNSLVTAKIIPYDIVPKIIDAIKDSEIIISEKLQSAFNMVQEEEYYIDEDDEIDNEDESNYTSSDILPTSAINVNQNIIDIATQATDMRKVRPESQDDDLTDKLTE